MTQGRALAAMTICSLCWCFSSLFIKLCPFSGLQVACVRGFIAAAALTLYLVLIEKKRLIINPMVLFVSVFVCFKYITFISANKLTAGANCVAMHQTNVVYILIFTCVMERHLPKKGDVAVIIATAVGIALFFFGKFDFSGFMGNILAGITGICTAVLFFMSGKFRSFEENLSSIIIGNILSGIIALAFCYNQPFEISPRSVSTILFLGLIQQSLAFIMYSKAIRVISPFACSILASMEPVLSPVLLFIFLDERPSQFALIGIVVVIGSIIIWNTANYISNKRSEQELSAQSAR